MEGQGSPELDHRGEAWALQMLTLLTPVASELSAKEIPRRSGQIRLAIQWKPHTRICGKGRKVTKPCEHDYRTRFCRQDRLCRGIDGNEYKNVATVGQKSHVLMTPRLGECPEGEAQDTRVSSPYDVSPSLMESPLARSSSRVGPDGTASRRVTARGEEAPKMLPFLSYKISILPDLTSRRSIDFRGETCGTAQPVLEALT